MGCSGCTKKDERNQPSDYLSSQTRGDAPQSSSQKVQMFNGEIVQMIRLPGPEGDEQIGIMLRTPQGTIQ